MATMRRSFGVAMHPRRYRPRGKLAHDPEKWLPVSYRFPGKITRSEMTS